MQLLRDIGIDSYHRGGHAILQTSRRLEISSTPPPGDVAAVSGQADNFNQIKIWWIFSANSSMTNGLAMKLTPASNTPLWTTAFRAKPVVKRMRRPRPSLNGFVRQLVSSHVGHDNVGE